MAIKVLSGTNYTQARLAGIMHEAWVDRIGRLVESGNTVYGHGVITNNVITGAVGLVVDTEDLYYGLPEIHGNRLVDVVAGDGWVS